MRKLGLTLLGVMLLIGIFTTGFWLGQRSNDPSRPVSNGTACTEEARLCPDGTAIGREGPDCEFPDCPGETPAARPE